MALDDASDLLSAIQLRGMVPVNSGSWSADALLKIASDELFAVHLPLLVAAKGEYLVKQNLLPTVQAQEEYEINPRVAAIRHISLMRQDNHELPIDQMDPPAQAAMLLDRTRQGVPRWFWFRENFFGVWPLPTSELMSFKVRWHIRPNRIVQTSNCWQISSIAANSPGAGQTTLGFATVAPTAMAGPVGTKYDVIGQKSPFPIKSFDISSQFLVTGGASTSMVFNSVDLPTNLQVGDWVAPFQQSPYANIPLELHPALALRTGAVALRSRDAEQADKLTRQAEDMERRLVGGLLAPRSKGNIKRIVTSRWRRRL